MAVNSVLTLKEDGLHHSWVSQHVQLLSVFVSEQLCVCLVIQ